MLKDFTLDMQQFGTLDMLKNDTLDMLKEQHIGHAKRHINRRATNCHTRHAKKKHQK